MWDAGSGITEEQTKQMLPRRHAAMHTDGAAANASEEVHFAESYRQLWRLIADFMLSLQ